MLWGFIKRLLVDFLILIFLAAIISNTISRVFWFLFSWSPVVALIVVCAVVIWVIGAALKHSYEEYKFYAEHIKPDEDAFNKAMRDYYKAVLKDIKLSLKNRNEKTTP